MSRQEVLHVSIFLMMYAIESYDLFLKSVCNHAKYLNSIPHISKRIFRNLVSCAPPMKVEEMSRNAIEIRSQKGYWLTIPVLLHQSIHPVIILLCGLLWASLSFGDCVQFFFYDSERTLFAMCVSVVWQ